MSDSAHVTSVEAVAHFLAALRRFQDEAVAAADTLEQQTGRALMHFDQELPAAWQRQVRRGFDDIGEARARYETCRTRTVAGHRSACHEEKQDYEQAKRRLREAQEQVELVRQWGVRLHKEIDEYRGRSGRLKHFVEGDLHKTAALLERTLDSLEKYTGGNDQ